MVNAISSPHDDEPRLEVEERGDILVLRYFGAFDSEAYLRVVVPMLKKHLRQPGKRWRELVDLTHMRIKGFQVVLTAARMAKDDQPYEVCLACIGVRKGAARFLFERFIALSGYQALRLFDSEEEAMVWLRAYQA